MKKVVIVIVNWNTGELLGKCLKSLGRLPEKELIAEVIVIDNASHDKSLALAHVVVGESINRPKVRFIKQKNNLGFAKANNVALRRVRDGIYDQAHVLLLNPDTEMMPGALSNLLKILGTETRAGVVGARLNNMDGTLQQSVRAFPTLPVFVFSFLKLSRLMPDAKIWRDYIRTDLDYDKQQSVDQVMGAVFLIRNEAFSDIGLLDERFWIWFEEVDYCKRAKDANWEIIYTPESHVLHHGAVSFNQLVGFKKVWPWLMSSLRYANKHLSNGASLMLWLLLPIALLLIVPAMVIYMMQHKRKNNI